MSDTMSEAMRADQRFKTWVMIEPAEDVPGIWVACGMEIDIASQGKEPLEALRSVGEALELSVTWDLSNGKDPRDRCTTPIRDRQALRDVARRGQRIKTADLDAWLPQISSRAAVRIAVDVRDGKPSTYKVIDAIEDVPISTRAAPRFGARRIAYRTWVCVEQIDHPELGRYSAQGIQIDIGARGDDPVSALVNFGSELEWTARTDTVESSHCGGSRANVRITTPREYRRRFGGMCRQGKQVRTSDMWLPRMPMGWVMAQIEVYACWDGPPRQTSALARDGGPERVLRLEEISVTPFHVLHIIEGPYSP